MSDRLVTTTEAAEAVGVSARSLARWVQDGRVEPTMRTPGGHLRWDVDDLRKQLTRVDGSAASGPSAPPVVTAIVVSENGVLAGRRRDGQPPWTFIAGEVARGEAPAHTAAREVHEKTGLLVRASTRPIAERMDPRTGRSMIYLECFPVTGNTVRVGDPDDLAEIRWLSLDEVDELLPDVVEPVREFLGQALSIR